MKLRELDPDVKITGPSLAGYNGSFMQDFLSFCKTNNCLPDIIGWHEELSDPGAIARTAMQERCFASRG
jgi:hypothetical protein